MRATQSGLLVRVTPRWSAPPGSTHPPVELAPAERAALAAARRRDVAAAVASRVRLAHVATELGGRGAPPPLVAALTRAGRIAPPRVAALAGSRLRATVAWACVDETLAVADLAARLAGVTDPAAGARLAAALRSYGRASSLAWETARWLATAPGEGGAAVREALDLAIARAEVHVPEAPDIVSASLRARGVPPRRELALVRHAALAAIVRPAVEVFGPRA